MSLVALALSPRLRRSVTGSSRRTLRVVERNMREGRIGLRSGQGFLDYAKLDIDAYRRDRLEAFVAMLKQLGLARPPAPDE